jgi:ABC-2 type transport system permease protein
MNKMMSLIKTDINVTFGFSALAYSFKSGKRKWTNIIIALAMLSLIPSYVMMVQGLNHLYGAFRQIGQQSYFLMMGIMAAHMIVFFLGLLSVMSKLYFSKDVEQLVPLPIRPSQIVASRFISLVVAEYLISLPIILPFLIIYGIREYGSILYWLFCIILAIVTPLLPLSLAVAAIMMFMKHTNIKAKKDAVRLVGALIFMLIIVFAQMKINQIVAQGMIEGDDFLFDLARDTQFLVKNLGKAYPPAMWAAMALTGVGSITSWINLLGFVTTSVGISLIAVLLSEKLYLDGLIGNNETASSKVKAGDDCKYLEGTSKRKPYLALAHKELMMLFKTPVYVMNSVGGVAVIPIILVMSLMTGGNDMEAFRDIVVDNRFLIILAGAGMIALLGMLNSIGVTTFSREGVNFWIQRTLPISAVDQIFGRVLASLAIQGIGAVFLLASLFFISAPTFGDILMILLVGSTGSIAMTMLGMTIDIIRPLRDWTNPQQAMKQNLNVLIGMAVSALYLGFLGYGTYLLKDRINHVVLLLGLTTVFCITIVLDFSLLKRLIEKQFMEMEK